MGMFDYITCEYPLSFEEVEKSMENPPVWSKMEFQTKSFSENLGGFLENYTIEEDGQLYLDKINRDWVENEDGTMHLKESPDGIEKQDYTGELCFQGVHLEESNDFYLEIKALFWKGELKEIYLDDWQKRDNSERIEAQEKFLKNFAKLNKKSLWSKIFYPFKLVVFFFTALLRYFLGLIVRFTWKLDRWIS